ncbi:MAG: UDP-N-acetylmuramoyl-L-alanine--D-glutamate ligase [Clostridiales bacterium]|nr:UDP-N-acetylmuramoyl-L-alanine--D-glutamate ligase [Clostridiales bacterium]
MSGEFGNQRILVVGLGKSGMAAFDALVSIGVRPYVYDKRDIELEEHAFFKKVAEAGAGCYLNGSEVPDEGWGILVLSPGVPPDLPFVERARERGAEVIGELELSYRIGSGLCAAITGTNGKTTTTTLVGEIFSDAGLKAAVCGNIGTPVAAMAMDADDDTWLVTEVSSYQLDTARLYRPRIAAFLNLTPDHMDRHKTMEAYGAAKAKIFANQGEDDVLVYNADDPLVAELAEGARARKLPFSHTRELTNGAFVRDGWIMFAEGNKDISVAQVGELRIPGTHNIENALAATAVAFAAGIRPEVIAATLRRFKGVEHRIEFVADIRGVRYVNDSKGTNPDASIKAVEAVGDGENPDILLIAGGYDKDADFTDYIKAIKGRVKKLILLGTVAEKMQERAIAEGFLQEDVPIARDMGEAVRLAATSAGPGDTVLLSPACASWDMYKDYEERGMHFKDEVWKLEGRK